MDFYFINIYFYPHFVIFIFHLSTKNTKRIKIFTALQQTAAFHIIANRRKIAENAF